MKDEEIEKVLEFLSDREQYKYAPMPSYQGKDFPEYFNTALEYINRLKEEIRSLRTQIGDTYYDTQDAFEETIAEVKKTTAQEILQCWMDNAICRGEEDDSQGTELWLIKTKARHFGVDVKE